MRVYSHHVALQAEEHVGVILVRRVAQLQLRKTVFEDGVAASCAGVRARAKTTQERQNFVCYKYSVEQKMSARFQNMKIDASANRSCGRDLMLTSFCEL